MSWWTDRRTDGQASVAQLGRKTIFMVVNSNKNPGTISEVLPDRQTYWLLRQTDVRTESHLATTFFIYFIWNKCNFSPFKKRNTNAKL